MAKAKRGAKAQAATKKESAKPTPRANAGAGDLQGIRARIDSIDEQIHTLLNERARCAQEVGVTKQAQGLHTADFYRPEREAQVLRKAMERNKGPLRNEEIVRLFREIMSACLAQEEP